MSRPYPEDRPIPTRPYPELRTWKAELSMSSVSLPYTRDVLRQLSTYPPGFVGMFEWKLPLRGRITYRHCRKPKLHKLSYSSNHLFGGVATDAGHANQTFYFSVPAISKLSTLTVESSWTAPTETARHHILAIDEASQQQQPLPTSLPPFNPL